tara:strand:- start:187 stop:447 length:261 start_codon:yes stop_codon:yes gene_type:complete
MPKYSYKCLVCEKEADFYHSMTDKISDCSSCGSTETMSKLPSKFTLFNNKKQSKTGDLVNAAIAENQEELQQEKEKLRNTFYEPNE